ncbi:DUF4355 domain-containing protein [Halobacillus massiliensis]|uniref:DUF4355 domain-containing protein n=1 Tax=Halobacillus massiliensis TaxID=1926286 RepID=UPI0015C4C1AF|nr:DUF4355 domain-containing protein [Halobacillus massiliensis]
MTELQSKLHRLNLQFFAEDDTSDSDTDQDDTNDSDDNQDQSFTQSDVDSAVSKAVDKALKNREKQFEKEKQRAIDDAKKDAKEYAKMTKSEQEQADFEKRKKALDDRERDLNLKQLRTEVEVNLKEEGLPSDFAESLITLEDNEKIKESISNIKKTFDEAVNHAVKEKLRQDPPEGNQSFKERQAAGPSSRAEMAKKARII